MRKDDSLTDGLIEVGASKIYRLKTTLGSQDNLGRLKARLGINRHNYKIRPGLYAVGNPNDKSLVLVTSNYKLTVDMLRKELGGLNLWILVLNTLGVNVWCAAGKGTFGTREIINRINSVNLKDVVSHKTLILPQLGAPGMSAHIITKETGFKVIYGPVRAKDIPKFINNNLEASKEMRRIEFKAVDRLEVSLLELFHSIKLAPLVIIFFAVYNLIGKDAGVLDIMLKTALNALAYMIALIIGTIILPLLLPFIPFRSFSLKGLVGGIVWSIILALSSPHFGFDRRLFIILGNAAVSTALISFLALNFTGSTTYTSLSGVQKETLYAVPPMALGALIGVALLIVDKIQILLS